MKSSCFILYCLENDWAIDFIGVFVSFLESIFQLQQLLTFSKREFNGADDVIACKEYVMI